MRKLWSPHNFKSIVSPQEFILEVSTASKKRFNMGTQADAVDLLAWLLGELHRGLVGSGGGGSGGNSGSGSGRGGGQGRGKGSSSIISTTFGGTIELTTLTKGGLTPAGSGSATVGASVEHGSSSASASASASSSSSGNDEWRETTSTNPFTFLSLDIPPMPMFRDSEGGLIIPQVQLPSQFPNCLQLSHGSICPLL